MERLRKAVGWEQQAIVYEPLEGGSIGPDGERIDKEEFRPFSWLDYSIFLLLGVAMLWAWNMFLAANPYFQRRFESDKWILEHFQSASLSVSTLANLGCMLVLTKLQRTASYPKRIILSFIISIASFTLLALSAVAFLGISPGAYLAFLLLMVLAASLGTGFLQNGLFAFVQGFGRVEYTQAIMAGQAVAGVLPCIAQIISVLAVDADSSSDDPDESVQQSPKAAFSYFLVAVAVSTLSLIAFFILLGRQNRYLSNQKAMQNEERPSSRQSENRKTVGMWTLLKKLHWIAGAIFLCFGITMFYPVYTQQIHSVRPESSSPPIFKPASFIPLAFLFWNVGDLIGRLLTLVPHLSFTHYPKTIFVFSIARVVFIPMYLLCNGSSDKVAIVNSDAFYLFVIQLGFGMTNGWLGSSCMMATAYYVDEGEREAAGGFMGLSLVAGLSVGSLLSFLPAKL